ncbi:hypothetical protein INR49_027987 [Caranx melampygus]|nr:hypothetical protein INR49_027987 [Caranx melampygus]
MSTRCHTVDAHCNSNSSPHMNIKTKQNKQKKKHNRGAVISKNVKPAVQTKLLSPLSENPCFLLFIILF